MGRHIVVSTFFLSLFFSSKKNQCWSSISFQNSGWWLSADETQFAIATITRFGQILQVWPTYTVSGASRPKSKYPNWFPFSMQISAQGIDSKNRHQWFRKWTSLHMPRLLHFSAWCRFSDTIRKNQTERCSGRQKHVHLKFISYYHWSSIRVDAFYLHHEKRNPIYRIIKFAHPKNGSWGVDVHRGLATNFTTIYYNK